MVDAGEQTGALPEMFVKIADNYDDEVDNAVSAMLVLAQLLVKNQKWMVVPLFMNILNVF